MTSVQASIFPRASLDYDEDDDYLGGGAFGNVFRCRLRGSGELVAVKVFYGHMQR